MSWSWSGEVTQYADKFGIFLIPGLAILTGVGMRLMPLIDPKKKNYPSFQKAYLNIRVFLLSFLIAIQIIITVSYTHLDVYKRQTTGYLPNWKIYLTLFLLT